MEQESRGTSAFVGTQFSIYVRAVYDISAPVPNCGTHQNSSELSWVRSVHGLKCLVTHRERGKENGEEKGRREQRADSYF